MALRPDLRVRPAALAATVAGLLAAALVVSLAVFEAAAPGPLTTADATGMWTDPRVALDDALQPRAGGLHVSRDVEALARKTARQWPLAAQPFLIEGIVALAENQGARAEALLAEARRRDPRAELPRLLLLSIYIRDGQAAAAAGEISALARLLPEASVALMPQAAQLALAVNGRGPTIAVFREQPGVRDAVLAALATDASHSDLVMRLAAATGALAAADPAPAWQSALIETLLASGQVARARSIWERLAGVKPGSTPYLYDPRFAGLPGPAAFNWRLVEGGAGVAERSEAQGLQVEYYGRENATLARQRLTLPPGAYQLSSIVGPAAGSHLAIAWAIACDLEGSTIAQLPLAADRDKNTRVRAGFVVPASGCGVQELRLEATPADIPVTQHVTIGAVSIERPTRR